MSAPRAEDRPDETVRRLVREEDPEEEAPPPAPSVRQPEPEKNLADVAPAIEKAPEEVRP